MKGIIQYYCIVTWKGSYQARKEWNLSHFWLQDFQEPLWDIRKHKSSSWGTHSGQVARWAAAVWAAGWARRGESPTQEAEKCHPSHRKGPGDLQQHWTLRWGRSWGPPDFVGWACEGIKAQEILTTRSLIRGSSLSCYFVVAPNLN